jgi:aspartyl protease family protein
MLRTSLGIIVIAGVAASMMGHVPNMTSAKPNSAVHMVDSAAGDPPTNASQPQVAMVQDGGVQLQREPNGHFYADVEINGTPIHMLVDTGATAVALSRDDARKAGIATSIGMPDVVGEGADGSVHGEYVTVERMHLGSANAEQIHAVVLNGGEQSLLGQEFLQKFASVEIHGDTMTLR